MKKNLIFILLFIFSSFSFSNSLNDISNQIKNVEKSLNQNNNQLKQIYENALYNMGIIENKEAKIGQKITRIELIKILSKIYPNQKEIEDFKYDKNDIDLKFFADVPPEDLKSAIFFYDKDINMGYDSYSYYPNGNLSYNALSLTLSRLLGYQYDIIDNTLIKDYDAYNFISKRLNINCSYLNNAPYNYATILDSYEMIYKALISESYYKKLSKDSKIYMYIIANMGKIKEEVSKLEKKEFELKNELKEKSNEIVSILSSIDLKELKGIKSITINKNEPISIETLEAYNLYNNKGMLIPSYSYTKKGKEIFPVNLSLYFNKQKFVSNYWIYPCIYLVQYKDTKTLKYLPKPIITKININGNTTIKAKIENMKTYFEPIKDIDDYLVKLNVYSYKTKKLKANEINNLFKNSNTTYILSDDKENWPLIFNINGKKYIKILKMKSKDKVAVLTAQNLVHKLVKKGEVIDISSMLSGDFSTVFYTVYGVKKTKDTIQTFGDFTEKITNYEILANSDMNNYLFKNK